jgi:hypothetical protein
MFTAGELRKEPCCAGLTCSSIGLMGDAAIEELSKVQGPAAPGALLIGCDLLGCQFIPHRSSSEGNGGWSAAFHQVHSRHPTRTATLFAGHNSGF